MTLPISVSGSSRQSGDHVITVSEDGVRRERLGYVRNPRSLMEGTETLCRDDIGDLPGSPEHL